MIRETLRDRTVLILLDEFSVYVENAIGIQVGDSIFGRQVLAFVPKLTTQPTVGQVKTELATRLEDVATLALLKFHPLLQHFAPCYH